MFYNFISYLFIFFILIYKVKYINNIIVKKSYFIINKNIIVIDFHSLVII